MEELTAYMSAAVERLVRKAWKLSIKNPRELIYLAQYKKYSKRSAELRKEAEAQGRHIPPFLIASISSACNLKCAGCYAHENSVCGEKAGAEPLDSGRWRALFEEAAALGIGFALLAGGEPLLRREVLEEAAKVREILFPVFTNGTLLDNGYADFFDRNRNLLPVLSVEGGRERTDARRGNGVYERLQGAMERLKEKCVFFGTSITVTKENLAEVTADSFLKALSDQGCSLVFFVEYVPADGRTAAAPDDEDRAFLAGRLLALRESCPMLLLSFPGDEKALGGCLAAGRGFFHINPAGGAEPCPFSPFSDTSLKDKSLAEALASPLFRRLTAEEFLNEKHSGGCSLFERREEVEALLT